MMILIMIIQITKFYYDYINLFKKKEVKTYKKVEK